MLMGELTREATPSVDSYHDPQWQCTQVCDHIEKHLLSPGATFFERLWFVIGLLYACPELWETRIKGGTEAGVYERYHTGFHEFIDTCLMGTFEDDDSSKAPPILAASKHPFEICLLCLDRFQSVLEDPRTAA